MRGGAREGAGRKKISSSISRDKTFTMKCTNEEREAITDLLSKCKKKKKAAYAVIIIESLKKLLEY